MFSVDKLTKISNSFEKEPPENILRWAFDLFGNDIAVSSSFGVGSGALLHMVNKIKPGVRIFFIDTYYHFTETLNYKKDLEKLLNLNIVTCKTKMPRKEFLKKHTFELYSKDPDLCCYIHKVHPMKDVLKGLNAWITGLRRKQTDSRRKVQILEKYKEGVVKVNPLVNWSSKKSYDYMKEHNIPFHPLFNKGYTSIGCWPCTRPVFENEDERAGRWAGKSKSECGMHTLMHRES